MTLTTHALVGAAVAQFFPDAASAFAVGFASHFAIDALPHWDYSLHSSRKDTKNPLNFDMELGRSFAFDMLRIAFDVLLGLALTAAVAYVLHLSLYLALIGAVAGIVPDGLQFVYFKTRSKLLEPLQRFHIWIQEGKSLKIPAWKGISLQAALVIVLVSVVKLVL